MGLVATRRVREPGFRVSEKVRFLKKSAAEDNRLSDNDGILIMLIGFVLKQNLH